MNDFQEMPMPSPWGRPARAIVSNAMRQPSQMDRGSQQAVSGLFVVNQVTGYAGGHKQPAVNTNTEYVLAMTKPEGW